MTIEITFKLSGPKLTIDELKAFEREIDGRLPDDYKRFLLRCNGGLAEPPVGFRWRGKIREIPHFKPLLPGSKSGLRSGLSYLREFDIDGFLLVAVTMGEPDICLDFRDKIGAISLAVYSYENEVAVKATMEPFAKSFTEFLDKLVEIEVPYCRVEDLGRNGTPEDLEKYLAEGNLIDAVSKNDHTLLCESIKFSNIAMMQACIERGAGLAESLHVAAGHRRIDLVRKLIAAGADINGEDRYGARPLDVIGGTALPGERGDQNRAMKAELIRLGACIEPDD